MKRYEKLLESNLEKPIIRTRFLQSSFIMPVNEEDVREVLRKVSPRFLKGLKAVFLLGGSKSQEKAWKLFSYGCYWQDCIFLHAYPKKNMSCTYKKPPKPSDLKEYERAGAKVEKEKRGVSITFEEWSLKKFYLNDVLIHEIGHHMDEHHQNSKSKEAFADWFATEYGYRLPAQNI